MSAAVARNPLHFIPDSTLTSHSFRLSRAFKNSALAAGYGMSALRQDSFAARQTDVDITRNGETSYTSAKIASKNLFLSGKCQALPSLETEAYLKTGTRNNRSDFPVPGLVDPANAESLDMKLDRLKSMEYGLDATLRPAGAKSSLGAGWKREVKKRGFSLGTNAESILPERILYKEVSKSDNIFLKGVTRPMDGLVVRLTPSYKWAEKVGSTAEAEEALYIKTEASYVTAGGKSLDLYYAYTHMRNNALDYTGFDAVLGRGFGRGQEISSVLHSAGASLSAALTAKTNSSVSLDWNQSNFQSYYITSSARRYETAIAFTARARSRSLINTTSLAADTDWQIKENLKLTGGYTLSRSKGDVASGLLGAELAATNDGAVDNYLHVVSLGADCALAKDLDLLGRYAFDRYVDNQYSSLSGRGQTLTASVAYKF